MPPKAAWGWAAAGVAGIAQPRLRLRAGMAVPRPGHGSEIAGGFRAGAGFDFRGTAGGGESWLKVQAAFWLRRNFLFQVQAAIG